MLPIIDERRLTTCAYEFWEKGGHNGLMIIDSQGVELIVKEARKIGYPGFLFGYSLLRHRGVKVELVYETESRLIPLEELKSRVIDCIKSERDFWGAADLKALFRQIRDAKTHKQIIESLL